MIVNVKDYPESKNVKNVKLSTICFINSLLFVFLFWTHSIKNGTFNFGEVWLML